MSTLRIAASALLLWLAQPPLAWWPLAFVALTPWLVEIAHLASRDNSGWMVERRRTCALVWIASACYWLVSLQGLRHAHPAMVLCLVALSGYLAIYPVIFFIALRRWLRRRVPMIVAAPVLWVGIECIRNYALTGLSAAMLGHTLADIPGLVQIADLGGTYAVSFIVVAVNVAVAELVRWRAGRVSAKPAVGASLAAAILMIATIAYGSYRLNESTEPGTTSFLLVGRDERVEYDQSAERADEIFSAYVQGSIEAARRSDSIDVVVWPESMFSGSLPWFIADEDATIPDGVDIDEYHEYFYERTRGLGRSVAAAVPQQQVPHLIVGCGVVRFAEVPLVYSGLIHVGPTGRVSDWYGKTHLVMFGEYIPLVRWVPGLSSLVPAGLGVQVGAGAKAFQLDAMRVAGNICIETAVERVTVNHCRDLLRVGSMPDAMVTVTNDGWFDHTSVVDHHLRCAQLVAVGCRRPILSAANGGPTAWIDSNGRVVEKLAYAANGALLAKPRRDSRESVYVQIGDWPARLAAFAVIGTLLIGVWRKFASTDLVEAPGP